MRRRPATRISGPPTTPAWFDYLPDQPVAIVGGSPRNMKVTTQDDMPLARALANALAGAPRGPQNERQRAAKEQLHAMFGKAFGVEGE